MNEYEEQGLTGWRSAINFPALKERRVLGSFSRRLDTPGTEPSIARSSAFILFVSWSLQSLSRLVIACCLIVII